MELREFFGRIDPRAFTERFLSLLPGETGADPNEFKRRATEAQGAMPLLHELARQQQEAVNKQARHRITMLAVGMMTLHALAEDMRYEW